MAFSPGSGQRAKILIWIPVTLVRFSGWPQGSCRCKAGVRHWMAWIGSCTGSSQPTWPLV